MIYWGPLFETNLLDAYYDLQKKYIDKYGEPIHDSFKPAYDNIKLIIKYLEACKYEEALEVMGGMT
ncbi:unnamed protein product, partial [marine sediment metagenome]